MDVYLDGLNGEYSGRQIEIGYSKYSIGRGSGNRLRLLATNVSREHAVIYFTNGVYVIQDRGSRLGTFVNGKCVQNARLYSGDVITIGTSSFRFVQKVHSQPYPSSNRGTAEPVHKSHGNTGLIFLVLILLVGGVWGAISLFNRSQTSTTSSSEPENHAENEVQSGQTQSEQPTADNSVSSISADYLFKDDFETGLSNEWRAEDGEWHMINGRLQPVSGSPASIVVGDSSWSDYTVEMKIGGLRNTITGPSMYLTNDPNILMIGVRNTDNAVYLFRLGNYLQDCSLLDENGVMTTFYKGEDHLKEDSIHLVKVGVDGNMMYLQVDGRKICEFSDNTVQAGSVVIASYPGTGDEPTYPWVEEIAIIQR